MSIVQPAVAYAASAGTVAPRPAKRAVAMRRRAFGSPAQVVDEARARPSLWLPAIALVSACGLATIVAADAVARSGHGRPVSLFWLGFLAIIVPVAYRLVMLSISRGERIALVILLGLQLYFVKVVYEPFGPTIGDEFIHVFNTNAITTHGHLFQQNPIIPVSGSYPGLEAVTAALASLTGLSAFASGTIIVAIARALIMLALYLFYEEITSSPRVASIAALLYAANPNFLYFNAQFKYESLALTFGFVSLLAVTKWQRRMRSTERRTWAILGAVAIAATVVTHHVTAYALVAYLLAATTYHHIRRKPRSSSPLPFALFATAATVAWLFTVAAETQHYLGGIFSRAFAGSVDALTTGHSRALFGSSHGATRGSSGPLLEQVVGVGSVAVMLAILPFAFQHIRRKHRSNAHMLVLAGGAAFLIATYALRFVPSAWETANRAGEFLFVGMAAMLALGARNLVSAGPRVRTRLALYGGAIAIVFMGQQVAGWPFDLRLPYATRISEDGRTVDAQGYAIADWARSALGPGSHIAADDSNRRLLVDRGATFEYKRKEWAIHTLLSRPRLTGVSLFILDKYPEIGYVVADRRWIAFDNTRGYRFPPRNRPDRKRLQPPGTQLKFEHLPRTQRLVDTGDAAVYDLTRSRSRAATR